MRIQSINQNNYHNNCPKRTASFKQNFCFDYSPMICVRNRFCPKFIDALFVKQAELINYISSKAGGKEHLKIPVRGNAGRIYFLDEKSAAEYVNLADETKKVAFLAKIHSGENGEVLLIKGQEMCNAIKGTEYGCNPTIV